MVFGMEITYDELFNILDIEYIPLGVIGFTLPPIICEISDLNLIMKNLLPDGAKVSVTIDDMRIT